MAASPSPSLMLLKGKAKPAEAPAVATPVPAAPKGNISFGTKPAVPAAAPAPASVVETPVEETVADTATAQPEATEVDIDKMSSAEIDKLIKESGYEADMPEGFAKMKVAEKRAIIKKMFGGEAEAAAETPVETVATETPAAASVPAVVAPPKGGKTTPAKAKAGVVAEFTGKDAIADFAHHVENLKEKDALELAALLNDETERTYFRLGGVLAVIQSNGWFAPFASFREYIEQAHGLQYRTALYYVGIYNALVENKISWDSVKDLGWSKLKEIASIITPETVDQWVELAKGQTVLQLTQTVKQAVDAAKAQGGETTAQIQEGAAVTVTTKTFKVHEDQKKNIELALEKAKKDSGTSVDTVALDFICLDFLAGNAKAGKPAKLPSLAEQLKKVGVEEAFAAIEAAFPKVTVNVEVPEDGDLG